MADAVELWRRAAGADRLLAVAAEVAARVDPAGVARVRRAAAEVEFGSDGASLARTALELVRARTKLAAKWGADGAHAVADVAGAEMASSDLAAWHKARRFESCERVLDLCCGVGGDLRALPTGEGVELDPVRAWMAERNSGRPVRVGDVEALGSTLDGAWVHVDPMRREGRGTRRVRDALRGMKPGVGFLETCATRAAGMGVKLSPGVDAGELPVGELEVLSERGRLTQAVLWTGALGEAGVARATRLGGGEACTLSSARGDADEALRAAVVGDEPVRAGCVVLSADPALERAGLLGVLAETVGAGVVHPHAGLLVGEASGAADAWCARYRVLERLGWQRGRVAAAVRAHAEGSGAPVTVKTRGKVVDPDVEQSALRPKGDAARAGGALTVFVQRLRGSGGPIEALVCETC
jgi:hypothetical protein